MKATLSKECNSYRTKNFKVRIQRKINYALSLNTIET